MGPGEGTGRNAGTSTSGPPGVDISMTFMVLGSGMARSKIRRRG